jgi:hypothetical protein
VGRNNSTGFVFELNPQAGTGFAFNQADRGGGTDSLEAHDIERSRRVFTAGSYTFFVQVSASDQGTAFGVGNWHFTVDNHS